MENEHQSYEEVVKTARRQLMRNCSHCKAKKNFLVESVTKYIKKNGGENNYNLSASVWCTECHRNTSSFVSRKSNLEEDYEFAIGHSKSKSHYRKKIFLGPEEYGQAHVLLLKEILEDDGGCSYTILLRPRRQSDLKSKRVLRALVGGDKAESAPAAKPVRAIQKKEKKEKIPRKRAVKKAFAEAVAAAHIDP